MGIVLFYWKKGVFWKDIGIIELEEVLRLGLENRFRKLLCRLGVGSWVGILSVVWVGRFCCGVLFVYIFFVFGSFV